MAFPFPAVHTSSGEPPKERFSWRNKMCWPEVDMCYGTCGSKQRERELDQRLFALFKSWEAHVMAELEGQTMSEADMVDRLLVCAGERLPSLLLEAKESREEGTGGPG